MASPQSAQRWDGILVFDPDRDGDPDVASIGVSSLAWFENTNGIGTAWTPHTAASGRPAPR
jgi:hypothetical protein